MGHDAEQLIVQHERAGRRVEVDGVGTFVREQGEGEAVVCHHGVPVSSFVYRRILPLLEESGLRAVSFDYPGLGLSDRPADLDYSWSSLARHAGAVLDALEIERCHLVVHDIGGPIGLEWAVRNPDRVLSATVLDTMLDVATFRRPWTMRPFAVPRLGELYLRTTTPLAFRLLMRLQGVRGPLSDAEIDAHLALLRRTDGGRAFLRIMRSFELTWEKQRLLHEGLAPGSRPFPAQIVWGADDTALGRDHLAAAQRVLGIDDPILLPAKHFLQEDQPEALAGLVATFAAAHQGEARA